MQLQTMVGDCVAHSPDALFLVDFRGRIVAWNETLERLLGIPARQVVGRACNEVMCGRDGAGNAICSGYCPVAKLRDRGEPIEPFDMILRRGDGGSQRVRCTVVSLRAGVLGETSLLYHVHVPKVIEAASTGPAAAPSGAPTSATRPPPARDRDEESLSPRERQVLGLLAEGLGVDEIGRRLDISTTTARNHIQRILQKLGVHSRLEAVVLAYRRQLI